MPLTERLAIVLETVGTAPVVRDFNRVGAASQGLASRLRTVGTEAGGMSGLVKAGAAAGATALVAFAAKSVDAYFDMAQAILQFQRASGASAEQASALVAAFDDVGISAEVGAKAIFQLGKRLEEDGTKLAGYGVMAVRGANGNIDLAETLKDVADAYVSTTDPAQRAAMVNAAFGKSGQQLIPILERGRQGIEDLYSGAAATGQILTQDEIQKAEDFRLAVDELNDAMKQFQLEAGKALVPILTDLAKAVATTAEWVDKLRLVDFGKWLFGIGEFEDANKDAGDAAATTARKVEEAAEATEEQAKAVKEVEKAMLSTSAAQRSYDASVRAVTTAERRLTEARDEYNDLLKEGAVNEEKVADARRSLADATRSLQSAQRGLRERQEEYNEALTYFQAVGGDTAFDKLQDASDNLADAQDSVASAADRQTEAQQKLTEAQRGDPEFNDKLADAKLRVKDAEQGLSDAQFNSTQQAYELNQALETQDDLLIDNAAAIAAVRSEWAQLLALKPELVPFLQGPMAALGGAATPTAGGGLLSPTPTAGNLSPVTNNNQQLTVNVSGPAADPMTLARSILWELN
jgi:hypothetical protein